MECLSGVSIVCLSGGHGNPATAIAIENLVKRDPDLFAELTLLGRPASLPAEVFQWVVTKFPRFSNNYSKRGGFVRNLALCPMGFLSKLQLSLTQSTFTQNLMVVQEYSVAGYSKERLEEKYPGTRVLYVPDVYPKVSAENVARERGLKMAVWNEAAANRLNGKKIDVCLVQPVLPQGFLLSGQEIGQRKDRVVIKSSGSGIGIDYVRHLRKALQKCGLPFTVYLPDKVIKDGEETPLEGSLRDKIEIFYKDILSAPPRVFGCYPSEMIQLIAAGLNQRGVALLTFPPKGQHEVGNFDWARVKKLHSASIVPGETADLSGIIRSWFDNPPDPVPAEILGLGTEPVVSLFSAARKTVATV